MGYVEETGAAQYLRDARIGPIYEGTNRIQANDLVGRKLSRDEGAAVRALSEDIRKTAAAMERRQPAAFTSIAGALGEAMPRSKLPPHISSTPSPPGQPQARSPI